MLKHCKNCNREFKGREGRKFCSKRCGYVNRYYRSHSPRTCRWCLDEFWVKNSDVANWARHGKEWGLYCGTKCSSKAWAYSGRHVTLSVELEPLPKSTATDLAWAAGIIDGEGCIHVSKCKRGYESLHLAVPNTSTPMLDKLKATLGGKTTPFKRTAPQRRAISTWFLNGRAAAQALKAIRPYLVAKQDQCDLAIEFAKTIGQNAQLTDEDKSHREDLRVRLKALKHVEALVA